MHSLYFIAILPPEDLSRQIHEIRKACSVKFNVYKGLKPPVHITLHRPFKMESSFEKNLVRLLAPAAVHNGFEVHLENFGSFNIQVLYLNVLRNEALTGLYRKINGIINRNKLDPKEVKTGNRSFNPHITIAYRDIPAETFPAMWEQYKDERFKRTFTADRFFLLKHTGEEWLPLHAFDLKSEPETLTLF